MGNHHNPWEDSKPWWERMKGETEEAAKAAITDTRLVDALRIAEPFLEYLVTGRMIGPGQPIYALNQVRAALAGSTANTDASAPTPAEGPSYTAARIEMLDKAHDRIRQLEAENATLRAEVERWRELQEKTHAEVIDHVCNQANLESEVEALEVALAASGARADALAGALEPFAAYADPNKRIPAEMVVTVGSNMARRQLRMGDCYAALAALSEYAGSKGGE